MPNKRIWANGPNGRTPVNAERLNGMEDDITEALGWVAPVAALEQRVTDSQALLEDPANPGYYIVPEYSTVTPDPDFPDFYTIGT